MEDAKYEPVDAGIVKIEVIDFEDSSLDPLDDQDDDAPTLKRFRRSFTEIFSEACRLNSCFFRSDSESEMVCLEDDSIVVVQGEEADPVYFHRQNFVYMTEDGEVTEVRLKLFIHVEVFDNLCKNSLHSQILDDLDCHTIELSNPVPKPKMSYAQLIAEALMGAEGRKLTLAGIYQAIADKHQYYKLEQTKNWQNAIRHNLTLSRCFTKVPRPSSEGRGSYWKLEKGAEYYIFKKTLGKQLIEEYERKRHQLVSQPSRDSSALAKRLLGSENVKTLHTVKLITTPKVIPVTIEKQTQTPPSPKPKQVNCGKGIVIVPI